MLNLAVLLEDSARTVPDRTAIVFDDRRWTYHEVNAMANLVAGALVDRGIKAGDRVALSCPNLPYFPVVYYGILKAGAVVVPLSILLTEREISYHLSDSGARAFFCFEGADDLPMGERGLAAFDSTPGCDLFVLLAADLAAQAGRVPGETLLQFAQTGSPDFTTRHTAETDTAVVLYTSGTTGSPKGVELTHSNLVHNALMCSRLFNVQADDIQLVALPLFHTFGQTVHMNCGFATGTTLVLLPRFTAEKALDLLERENATVFVGVPTMYWALLNHVAATGYDVAGVCANLRLAVAGGSSLPMEVLTSFEERFGVPVLEGYGLSETSPVATFNRLDRPRRPGSIGLPVWGVEIRVSRDDGTEAAVDEPGEICVRGHNVMKGYLNRPEATAEAIDPQQWFHTGDIGTRDADGYVYVVDRKKDMIIRGGFNVYPREVEEVLLTHPAVSLAAVIGVPHPSHGEEVKAFVVLRAEAEATEKELVDWCREVMAAYKYPRIVEFMESLPMTATGKILKRALTPGKPHTGTRC
ncbi:acyl-CoA synthetase [Frankia sp. R43]|uniref:long-chain-fatty-acid--CoA ligase n=1 Tax=Frankia sp. R43 TaxID=269536 RepID=UPI0006CA3FA2|nr:long-chain fatty acid--CoA ligase [Frankia sp. R43]KPM57611.1 acyl-CoA synthetase [Frankia sp. R43]